MSRSGRRVASAMISSSIGSPSEARTAREVSAGRMVTSVMTTSARPKAFSVAVTVGSEALARRA